VLGSSTLAAGVRAAAELRPDTALVDVFRGAADLGFFDGEFAGRRVGVGFFDAGAVGLDLLAVLVFTELFLDVLLLAELFGAVLFWPALFCTVLLRGVLFLGVLTA
jgi:hypothetical protein